MEIGDRKNEGKLRWRNFPLFLIEPLIEVAAEGEKKYSTYNFLKGQYVNNCLDSMKRHLMKFESPYHSDYDTEDDPNSKTLHPAKIAWNALVICFIIKYMPHLDDRLKADKDGNLIIKDKDGTN